MTLSPSLVSDLAYRLHEARAGHVQTRSLLHDHPGMDMEGAYAVQHAWAQARLRAGAQLRGYKVGLTTPAVQRACGVDEPAYGHLFDDMVFADGAALPAADLFEPRVETELAFVLKAPLAGPDCTAAQALEATDYLVPALEIVDTRLLLKDPATGAGRGTLDTVADNTSAAAIVLGERRFKPGDLDAKWSAAILYRNGIAEASGVSGVVLGDPAASLAWLARALHKRGMGLEAGQVVMSGSFITPFPAVAGDAFLADFGPLGTLSCRFV